MSKIARALKLARHGYATDGYVDDPMGAGTPQELQAQPDDQPSLYDRAMNAVGRFATPPSADQVAYRGSVLPLSRDVQGNVRFDPSAGILGSAVSGATLPGDVYAGRVNPNSDEGYKRALDLAGLVTGGSGAFSGEANDLRMGIKAYHGSPHDFDKFDISKIGTGEGAQAYGHGLYFAGNENVAKNYRDTLAGQNDFISANGERIAEPELHALASDMLQLGYTPEQMEESLRNSIMSLSDGPVSGSHYAQQKVLWNKYAIELLKNLQGKTIARERIPGRMYQVDLGVNPEHLLDWDKPLSEQSEHVRNVLAEHNQGRAYTDDEFKSAFGNILAGSPYEKMSARNVLEPILASGKDSALFVDLVRKTDPKTAERLERAISDYGSPTGEQVYKSLGHSSGSTSSIVPRFDKGPAASEMLSSLGIPGIRYLDRGSRSSGEGTHNYVMFHHDPVSIERKYRRGGDVERALLVAKKFGPATARDAVKSAKAVRGRPVKG